MYCLAFIRFLQIKELTYLAADLKNTKFASWHMARRSVNIQANRLLLSLPASKTDCFCKEISFIITKTSDKACVVSFFQNLFTHFLRSATTPLFHSAIGLFTKECVIAWPKSDI